MSGRLVQRPGPAASAIFTGARLLDPIAGILDDLEAGNCARLAAGDAPVVPVSLHYFLRDADGPRPVPAEVAARTQRYVDGLPARCTARSKGERENR